MDSCILLRSHIADKMHAMYNNCRGSRHVHIEATRSRRNWGNDDGMALLTAFRVFHVFSSVLPGYLQIPVTKTTHEETDPGLVLHAVHSKFNTVVLGLLISNFSRVQYAYNRNEIVCGQT